MPIAEQAITKTQQFSDAYKDDLFILWFRNGQPFGRKLWEMIPEDWGSKPSAVTISDWIRDIFQPRAEVLNIRLNKELEERLIKEKIEMLYRHAEVGRELQKRARERLEQIADDELNAHAIVRFITEGVRIERESVGLPQALEKMVNQSDEELLNRIEALIGESPGEIIDG